MPALTADRTPDQLVGEMQRFFAVDWPTVWAGVPEDEAKRAQWCAGFGWRPLWFQSGLWVRTALGGRLQLVSTTLGQPVTRAEHVLCAARAHSTDENQRVTELTQARWTAYLDALHGLMGAPSWDRTWDASDFPELPGPSAWPSAQWRAKHQDPYRVAVWGFAAPEAPLIELRMSLGSGATTETAPTNARISVACHDSVHAEALRQARLG
ncbi:hypothetical protein [Streptomyces scabiei]|uniref:hypothetical protein n=1 Tax=Streptomyces scabiei TaxID=1930 RepID=UPI0029A55952|nr:hypothetical protein [Streptomyces scabiei]MDX3521358.1 hypothetical protein [Streptomyces scabiei]